MNLERGRGGRGQYHQKRSRRRGAGSQRGGRDGYNDDREWQDPFLGWQDPQLWGRPDQGRAQRGDGKEHRGHRAARGRAQRGDGKEHRGYRGGAQGRAQRGDMKEHRGRRGGAQGRAQRGDGKEHRGHGGGAWGRAHHHEEEHTHGRQRFSDRAPQVFFIGDRFLRELKEKSPRDITLEVSSKFDAFGRLLNSGRVDRAKLRVILELLAKGCESTMNQCLLDMLNCTLGSVFFDRHLGRYLMTLTQICLSGNASLDEVKEDLGRIATLVDCLLTRFPSQAAEMMLLDSLKTAVGGLKDGGIPLPHGLEERVGELITVRNDSVLRTEVTQVVSVLPLAMTLEDPPDDFRSITIAPTSEEITGTELPFLRPNIVGGAFRDLEQYLDIQFRLFREDLVGPLREGIGTLPEIDARGRRKPTDIRLYSYARVLRPVCTFGGLAHVVCFDVSRLRRVKWKQTKRMIFGSLLCFSRDNFRTIKLATVTDRNPEMLAKGLIQVQFTNGLTDVQDIQAGDAFTIAESPAYFEAYRHVLHRLQQVNDDVPLQKYIVQCKQDEMTLPRYLRSELRPDGAAPKMDLRNALECRNVKVQAVNVTDWNAWPPCGAVGLDESQLTALKCALTREFALIQGPPGTGKTYIGLKVMRALIDNRNLWDPDKTSPILVVCYTNHALDQFLEGVLQFLRRGIVRVGNRSKCEALQQYNLKSLVDKARGNHDIPGNIFFNQKHLRYRVHEMGEQMNMELDALDRKGIVGVHQLMRIPECVASRDLYDRDLFWKRGYSLLDEWLNIVAKDSAERAQAGDVAKARADVDERENGSDAESSIDADEEAEIIAAQRLLDGETYDRIEGIGGQEQAEDAEANVNVAEADPEGERSEDEEGGWQTVHMTKARRDHKVREGLERPAMTEEEASAVVDIAALPEYDRWRLYNYWLQKRREHIQRGIDELAVEFEGIHKRLQEVNEQEKLHVLRTATVIGMTTTGAARHQHLLQEAKPKIVVVEEAAEIYEAQVVTTLSSSCQQLILIGDHQQLRPNPHVYQLAKKYNLDISLFERMLKNGMPCQRLNVQHRMRPEIAELMSHIYTDLHNHESVLLYENIAGVKCNMFFVDHGHREAQNEDLKSHLNRHEAAFAAELCRYVMLQGVHPSKITVLTTYTGQVLALKDVMPKARFQGVRVTAVDNYQGEENDVIILSLVRSNDEGKIGFLSISNRVCVALSRAKKGFYCIGNMELLAEKSDLWKKILGDLKERGIVGPALELCCQNHPDRSFLASTVSDFKNAPEGGCTLSCEFRLTCGHVCARACHPYDPEHKEYKCRKACTKSRCHLSHPCPKKCFQECGKCDVLRDKTVPICGHIQKIPCYIDPILFHCKAPCSEKLDCGHACQLKCGDSTCTQQCFETVKKTWPCGHSAEVNCYEKERLPCPEPCVDLLDCGHPCTGTCGECYQGRLHKPCQSKCGRTLICSHTCNYPCTKNCPPCRNRCMNACVHSSCRKACGELCNPCMEPCQWVCEHYTCSRRCGEPCDRPRCNERCGYLLPCTHRCIGLCGEKCPTKCLECNRQEVTEIFFGTEEDPDAKFIELEDCGHLFEVTGLDQWMDSSQQPEEGPNGGRIQVGLRPCPRCKVAVRKSLRYGNIVKQALRDIEMVKKRIEAQEDQMKQSVSLLKRQAVALSANLEHSHLFGDRYSVDKRLDRAKGRVVVDSIVDNSDTPHLAMLLAGDTGPSATIIRRLRQRLTAGEVTTIQNQLQFLPLLVGLGDKIKQASIHYDVTLKTVSAKLRGMVDGLVMFLMRRELRDRDVDDFQVQMETAELELNYEIVKQMLRSRGTVMIAKHRDDALEIEGRLAKKTNREDLDSIRKKIKVLSDVYNVFGLSEMEKGEIVGAHPDLAKGHWFKCVNGHPYAIGNCGGAMEVSRCPECKAVIGGGSHQLEDGNFHAPEIDGSERPAWPM